MNVMRGFIVLFASLINFACSTNPAPVIDRLPSGKASKAPSTSIAQKSGTDWRPATYIVKKGDTLYSIGLEHGYDYKEIAQANNINPPYLIKVGQKLKFSSLNEPQPSHPEAPTQSDNNGVVTYAIGNDSPQESSTTSATTAPATIAINEPKALREPYSEEAYKKPLPTAKAIPPAQITTNDGAKKIIPEKPPLEKPPLAKSTVEPKPDLNTPETKIESKTETKPKTDANSQFSWAWPTKGKVIANFNEAGNKGIDIAGKMGQAIYAAAPGKVIYSGSDLRGYGKLTIIKHNATYLSVYANNSLILVKEGQQVASGQKIAEMGDTDSNTVKLHFEIRQQGKSVDPMKFLSAD